MKQTLPASKLSLKPKFLPLSIAAALTCASVSTLAIAEETSVNHQEVDYEISAGPLSDTLNQFAQHAGIAITFSSIDVKGIKTKGLQGKYSIPQALKKLLEGSNLTYKQNNSAFIIIPNNQNAESLDTLVVKGNQARFGDIDESNGFKAVYQSTATKTPLKLRETPQAISVVTSKSMEARQVDDIQSALELKASIAGSYFGYPGPFSGSAPNGGSNTFSIRGQRLDGQQDVRSNGFSLITETNHDTALYERIEVVKGPSGYYGQGSLGGFINMVRKKPQAEFQSSVSGQIGSYDTYKGVLDITGALNKKENVTGRLVAVAIDEGSFINGVETQRQTIAPSFEAILDDNTRVLLNLIYQNEEFIPTVGVPMKEEGDKEVLYGFDHSFYYGDPYRKEPSDIETIGASIRVDHEINDQWLTSLFLQKESVDRSDINNSYGFGFGDYHYFYASWDDKELDNWAGEVRLDGRFKLLGQEHRLTAGAELNRKNTTNANGYSYVASASTQELFTPGFYNSFDYIRKSDIPANTREESTLKSTAVYLQGVIGITERTKLLAGVRYDKAEQERLDLIENTKFRNTDHAWTTRIGLNHELNKNISAYIAYAESFQPVEATSKTGEVLKPETGTGYELGLKTEWFDGKLGANFAIYRQELDNQPIDDPDYTGPGDYSISAGLQRTDGIELEVTGSPLPGLTISTAAFYLDSEYIDKRDPNFGKSAWGALDSQFSIYTAYKLQQGPLKGFEPSITFIKTGDTPTSTWTEQQREVEGYERVDLGISYNELPNLQLSLQIRNALNKTYVEKIRGGGWYNYLGAPRTAMFKATYNF